jgi:hypothetical protein
LIGYDRYDTQTAVEAMNALYVDAGLLQNLFVPSLSATSPCPPECTLRRTSS